MESKITYNTPVPGLPFFTPQHAISPGSPADPEAKVPTLFQSLKIRDVTLRNRIVVAPMCQYSAAESGPDIGALTPYHILTLGHYALKGASLVFIEACGVQPNGRITPNCPGLWRDEQIPAMKAVADVIHSQGSICGVQLAHAGRKSSTTAPWIAAKQGLRSARADKDVGGWPQDNVGPCGGPDFIWDGKSVDDPTGGFWPPRELTVQEIEQMVKDWQSAALRAVKAGVKVIEIHAAHGYLLHQFLSPITNQRSDRYGGSFENRTRLLIEIIQAIRAVVPSGMPLFLRVSGTEWMDQTEIGKKFGTWDVDNTIQLAKIVSDLGVDLLDVSSAGNHPAQHLDPFSTKDYQINIAARVRKEIRKAGKSMLIGAVGLITEADQAANIVNDERGLGEEAQAAVRMTEPQAGAQEPMADLVLVARQFMREPEWVLRVAAKLEVDVACTVVIYIRLFFSFSNLSLLRSASFIFLAFKPLRSLAAASTPLSVRSSPSPKDFASLPLDLRSSTSSNPVPSHRLAMKNVSTMLAALVMGTNAAVYDAPAKIQARATSSGTSSSSLPTVTIKGNAFFSGDDRFYIRGIDYQPGGSSNAMDPLADYDVCSRDIPYFKELGLNTIRVYTVDNSKDHQQCMDALADAGIYLALDVNTPKYSINRESAEAAATSYNPTYLQSIFATIDAFAGYSNTLLFFSGNEVLNDDATTAAAPYVKAVTRDMKQYIAERGHRGIPVGYSAADVTGNQFVMAQYMACGDTESQGEFYAINNYEWCDPSSYTGSGWAALVAQYSNYSQPLFMSEYGCIKNTRTFEETAALYQTDMTSVFSGGLVYQYSEEGAGFGVMTISGSTVTPIGNQFTDLKNELASVSNPTDGGGYSVTSVTQTCPDQSDQWDTSPFTGSALPAMPSGAATYLKSGAGTGPGLSGDGSQDASGGSSSTASSGAGDPTATYSTAGTSGTSSTASPSTGAAAPLPLAPVDFSIFAVAAVALLGVAGGAALF
nr:1,3-beta-glucanosyltransferase gel1 [Quercus suber]